MRHAQQEDASVDRKRRAAVALAALVVASAAMPVASGFSDDNGNGADVDAEFGEDGRSVVIKAEEDIVKVVIADCEGATETFTYGDDVTKVRIEGSDPRFIIAKVWVTTEKEHDDHHHGHHDDEGHGQDGTVETHLRNDAAEDLCLDCDGPRKVDAVANQAETITVTWTEVDMAQKYNVFRAEGDGHFEQVATLDGSKTSFVDEDVTAGVTYRYKVNAHVWGKDTDFCDVAEVTAIPDLPGVFAASMAAVGGLGAYAMLRRRRGGA
jgi:hypothetical protein